MQYILKHPATIFLSLKAVARFYIGLYLALLLLNLLALALKHAFGFDDAMGFVPLFHFDYEQNAPTLFSVLLILQASASCVVIGRYMREKRIPWFILAFLFAFIALDEFASLHERLAYTVRTGLSTSGFFYYAWIIPYGVLLIVLAAYLFSWLIRLPKAIRNGYIKSAFIYLSGAVLLEGFEGWYFEGTEQKDFIYDMMSTVEESFEMLGLILFVYISAKLLLTELGISLVTIHE